MLSILLPTAPSSAGKKGQHSSFGFTSLLKQLYHNKIKLPSLRAGQPAPLCVEQGGGKRENFSPPYAEHRGEIREISTMEKKPSNEEAGVGAFIRSKHGRLLQTRATQSWEPSEQSSTPSARAPFKASPEPTRTCLGKPASAPACPPFPCNCCARRGQRACRRSPTSSCGRRPNRSALLPDPQDAAGGRGSARRRAATRGAVRRSRGRGRWKGGGVSGRRTGGMLTPPRCGKLGGRPSPPHPPPLPPPHIVRLTPAQPRATQPRRGAPSAVAAPPRRHTQAPRARARRHVEDSHQAAADVPDRTTAIALQARPGTPRRAVFDIETRTTRKSTAARALAPDAYAAAQQRSRSRARAFSRRRRSRLSCRRRRTQKSGETELGRRNTQRTKVGSAKRRAPCLSPPPPARSFAAAR
eukprot:364955-Chlamydomonas_euryale.AAC.21